jgi:hypothetical protein
MKIRLTKESKRLRFSKSLRENCFQYTVVANHLNLARMKKKDFLDEKTIFDVENGEFVIIILQSSHFCCCRLIHIYIIFTLYSHIH